MFALVFVGLLLVLGNARFNTPDYDVAIHSKVFRKWKHEFKVKYASIEENAHRFAVFLENWQYITKTNNKRLSYTLGLNQFAAMTSSEFRLYVHGHSGSCLAKGSKSLNRAVYDPKLAYVNLPTSVDWTTKGVVTPVKNQGQCGSCWAFSATGSTESRYAIKTGTLNSLSEQELVDCSGSYGNNGCGGGLMDNAFRYIQAKGGLCSESEYPYQGANGSCRSCSTRYNKISGHTDVQTRSEQSLMAAVAAGPVSIGIEADQSAFQLYNGGVMSGTCGTQLDHGVLVVGYGSQSGQNFWKVKNSWGANWGMDGYILMCRGCNKNGGQGECGILDQPSYPIAE